MEAAKKKFCIDDKDLESVLAPQLRDQSDSSISWGVDVYIPNAWV